MSAKSLFTWIGVPLQAAALVLGLVLFTRFGDQQAPHPDPTSGKIVPVDQHGVVFYVTAKEKAEFETGFFACSIVIMAISVANLYVRRKSARAARAV